MADLVQLLHRAAAWHAGSIAAVDGERRATFGDIERRTNRLANALIGLGGGPGGRVGILLPNSLEYLETDIALVKAGKAKVPINSRLSVDERLWVLADSGAEVVITDGAGLESIADAREQLPDLRNCIVVGATTATTTTTQHPYEQLLSDASDAPPGLPEQPDAPSVILYTSGTTGRPKGAASSFHGRRMTMLNMLVDELTVSPGDGMLHAGSMAHGSGSKSLAFFIRGARNVMMRKFDGEAFLLTANQEAATHTFLVPTMIASVLEAAREESAQALALKGLTYGGAPIAESLLRDALETFGNVLVQVYGSCEAPHPVTVLSREDHADLTVERAGSIGRETVNVEVRIADAQGRAVADGESGELLVRGDSVMTGYWNAPEATARAFSGGWYRSGDVARRDADGYLSIIDRQREMIITGGLNVYPAEVERVLLQHPGVKEVAVVGVPDERWGESVVAVVVGARGTAPAEEELVEHCRAHLAGYKKPRMVHFADSLPKGSTGKILKRELKESFWQGRHRMVN